MLRIILILIVMCCTTRVLAQDESILQEDNSAVLARYSVEMAHQVELLTAAFGLDEDLIESLEEELRLRVLEEQRFNDRHHGELAELLERMKAAGGGDDSPEGRAVTAKIEEIAATYPTNPRVVARWLENRLPPEVVHRGRPRLEELWGRDEQMRRAGEADLGRLAGTKKVRFGARRDRVAVLIPDSGKPIPVGHIGAEARRAVAALAAATPRFVRPTSSLRQRLGKRKSPPRLIPWNRVSSENEDQSRSGRVILPPAQPLDDWDRCVIEMCDRHAFSEVKIVEARAVLGKMRERAEEDRLSRAGDDQFGAVAESAYRGTTLGAVDEVIDGMFQELKLRLENLATKD